MYCRTCKIIAALIVLVLSFQGLVFGAAVKADFCISPAGNDSNPGTLQKPFATLSRARDAVRVLKNTKPDSDITVLIRDGTYYLKETVVFGLGDSGNNNQLITYANYPGEEPTFSSGVKITGWEKLKKYPNALPDKAKGKVWVAELPETKGDRWRFYTMYDGEQRLPRARSRGFAPPKGPHDGVPDHKDGFEFPERDIMRIPKGAPIRNWPNLEDVELFIRPHSQFIFNILPLKSVDQKAGILRTAIKGSYPLEEMRTGTYQEDIPESAWIENVIDFLDEPGEWVLNTQQGRLYYWPKDGKPGDNIMVPTLQELVKVEGNIDIKGPIDKPVRNLVFKGLTFIHGERDLWSDDDKGIQHVWAMEDKPDGLFRFRGAENCVIDACRFANSGGNGVRLDFHCQGNTVKNSLFENLGATAIFLCGYGPGTKDVNKRNLIFNNCIHDIGQLNWQSFGVLIWQSGENRIANNLLYNLPYNSIAITGARPRFFYMDYGDGQDRTQEFNDGWRHVSRTVRRDEVGTARTWETIVPFEHGRLNIIENNEIHHILRKLSDGSGIYASGTGPFNVIRRNYIHDVSRCHMIRTDGWQRDTLITENIVYNCWEGMTRKHYNHVENNIFVNMTSGTYIMFRRFKEEEPTIGSRIQRNICYHSGDNKPEFYQILSQAPNKPKDCDADYNLFYSKADPKAGSEFIKKIQADGIEEHSISADPLFVDLENGDFRLKPNSPALKLGFKQIDVTKIGLTENFPERFRKGI